MLEAALKAMPRGLAAVKAVAQDVKLALPVMRQEAMLEVFPAK